MSTTTKKKSQAERYCRACQVHLAQHRSPTAVCAELQEALGTIRHLQSEVARLTPLADAQSLQQRTDKIREIAGKVVPV